MNYTSTRDSALCTGASTAILTGIAPAVSYTHLTLPTIRLV